MRQAANEKSCNRFRGVLQQSASKAKGGCESDRKAENATPTINFCTGGHIKEPIANVANARPYYLAGLLPKVHEAESDIERISCLVCNSFELLPRIILNSGS